jgi:hypothetical protein
MWRHCCSRVCSIWGRATWLQLRRADARGEALLLSQCGPSYRPSGVIMVFTRCALFDNILQGVSEKSTRRLGEVYNVKEGERESNYDRGCVKTPLI